MTNELQGVWENPDPQDEQVHAEWLDAYYAPDAPIDVTLSALAYYYGETAAGGVVAGGCSQWFASSSAADGNVTTLTVPCADDGYLDTQSSAFDATSTTLRIGGDGTNQYQTWLHFCSVEIPAGATIVDAYIDFPSGDGYDGTNYNKTSYIHFACEDADSPTPPSSNADGQARTRTTAKEHQRIFNTNWDDTFYDKRTPNLIDVIQEVVDRAGWASGNSLQVWMDYTAGLNAANGYAITNSVESGNGPMLYVSYTTQSVTEITLTCDGDGYYGSTGVFFNNSATSLAAHDKDFYTFLHFPNATIPNSGRVVMANLQLTATGGDAGAGGGTIWLCDEDNSTTIASRADGTSRSLTTAKAVSLDRMGWEAGNIRKDVNFADVVQEVVDRAGWASGNSLQVIMLHETGSSGDNINVHSVEATTSAYRPTLRLMYVVEPYNETASGGVVGGGSSTNTIFATETATGGAVADGVAKHLATYNPDFSGGVVIGGATEPQVTINIEGGAVVGGDSITQYTTTITTEGGAVLNGLATIQSGFLASGGVLAGGTSALTSSTSVVGSGGVVVSPKSKLWTHIQQATSGGVVIVQPRHSTGYTHRMSLTIPAASLDANLTMMVGVRVPAVFNDCVVTTSAGRVLNSEIRETTVNNTCLFFRADLSATTDNEFLFILIMRLDP